MLPLNRIWSDMYTIITATQNPVTTYGWRWNKSQRNLNNHGTKGVRVINRVVEINFSFFEKNHTFVCFSEFY